MCPTLQPRDTYIFAVISSRRLTRKPSSWMNVLTAAARWQIITLTGSLSKPFIAMWAMRYGADLKTPSASIQGPKVMLINEMAGSGGDLLPWMFRHFKLGPLVGKRTWGGLVGVLGFPVLMDGGSITAPNLAFWTEEEGFGVENVGVPPDIEVEITPADYAAGRDPQLEKAIEVIMEMLKQNPPKKMQRPPYPVRVRK